MGRRAFEEAPYHEVNNLCILVPARVPCSVHDLLRETYLCLLEVARLEGTSSNGRRQLLSKRLNIFDAFPRELFFVVGLCCLVFTDHS